MSIERSSIMEPTIMIRDYKSFCHLLIFFLSLTVCFHCINASDTGSIDQKINRARRTENSPIEIVPKTLTQRANGPSLTAPIKNVAHPTRRQNQYRLPSWFDYNQFKRLFGKRYSRPEEDEIHKRIYLRTALKVFEERALYRTNRSDILPSINELSDMVSTMRSVLESWINKTT